MEMYKIQHSGLCNKSTLVKVSERSGCSLNINKHVTLQIKADCFSVLNRGQDLFPNKHNHKKINSATEFVL